jgi:hypothetical protein
MTKILLGIAAGLSAVAAVLCVGCALLEAVIAYQVSKTGMFHGMTFSARPAIYAAVSLLWLGVAMAFVARGFARIRMRIG